jgi:hypothetical protein
MAVQALGYAGFGSDKIEDWRDFGTGLVGLQAVERGARCWRSGWTTASSGS